MNILNLKRSAYGHVLRMPSDGGSESGRDGSSDGRSGGEGSSSNGGGSYGSLGTGTYGLDSYADNFGLTGFTSAITQAPADTNYGYVGAGDPNRTNVGVTGTASSREMSVAAKVNDLFAEYPALKAALGFLGPVGIAVGLAAKLGEKYGGTYTDADVTGALNSGAVTGYSGGNGGGGSYSPGYAPYNGGAPAGSSIAEMAAGAVNLQDPATLAARIANDGWTDFNASLPGMQGQIDTMGQRGNDLYGISSGVAAEQLGMSRQMSQDYNNVYRPFQQQQADYVNKLGSQGYIDQQRSLAMAGIQQQYDNQMGQNNRAMTRMGVNPSSGRMMAMQNQGAIQSAAAKVGAAAAAERGAFADYATGMNTMNTNGLALQKQSLANSDSSAAWSKFGLSSGATGLGLNMDFSKLKTAGASGYGGIASNAASAKNGAQQVANQANQYDQSNDLGNLVKSAAVGFGTKWLFS